MLYEHGDTETPPTPPPPPSPVRGRPRSGRRARPPRPRLSPPAHAGCRAPSRPQRPADAAHGVQDPRLAVALELAADRKSTRLNSSHANISYAVFCLTKKQHYDLD